MSCAGTQFVALHGDGGQWWAKRRPGLLFSPGVPSIAVGVLWDLCCPSIYISSGDICRDLPTAKPIACCHGWRPFPAHPSNPPASVSHSPHMRMPTALCPTGTKDEEPFMRAGCSLGLSKAGNPRGSVAMCPTHGGWKLILPFAVLSKIARALWVQIKSFICFALRTFCWRSRSRVLLNYFSPLSTLEDT